MMSQIWKDANHKHIYDVTTISAWSLALFNIGNISTACSHEIPCSQCLVFTARQCQLCWRMNCKTVHWTPIFMYSITIIRLAYSKCNSLMQWSPRLSSVLHQISKTEVGAIFCHLYGNSRLPSKNMHPKSILPQQQFQECVSLLFRSISNAACFKQIATIMVATACISSSLIVQS